MAILKNRRIVILIAVVVACLETIFGVYRTSARYTRDIEAMFYDGVYLKDEGYTQPGIDSHLNNAANAALGFATLVEKYHPGLQHQAGELISARREFIAAKSIGEKSSAYSAMSSRFYELFRAVSENPDIGLPEHVFSEPTIKYVETFSGANSAFSSSEYNVRVSEYLDGRSFLMRFIGALAPVREPEYFLPEATLLFF